MDEQRARRELRAALKRRRAQQRLTLGLLAGIALASLVIAGISMARHRAFSGEQLLPLIYGGLLYVVWRLAGPSMDTRGELVACRVVHPHGMDGRGLRIRRPDGALLAVPFVADKTMLNTGDEVWFVAPQDGRRLIGVTWDPLLGRGQPVTSALAARLVVPPGAVPGGALGAAPEPLAIRPLGPPPLPMPDGIDERQARAALAQQRWLGRLGRSARPGQLARSRSRAVTPPDVPLEVVAVDGDPPSAYAPRTGPIVVRRADGTRLTWPVTLQTWPARGSTAWATRVSEGEHVRLVVPTPAGDVVVVEPGGPATPAA